MRADRISGKPTSIPSTFAAFFKKQKDTLRLPPENQLALKESHRPKDLPRVSNPFKILFWHLRADILFIKGIFAEKRHSKFHQNQVTCCQHSHELSHLSEVALMLAICIGK